MPGDFALAELSEGDKERIVVLLAQFKRPAEVAAIMREEHGLDLGTPKEAVDQVMRYDPTRATFRADREKWGPIFEAAREAYTTDLKQVVVANQSWRLNELHDLYTRAKGLKNFKLAAELLEQIAKECGGALTNSRELNVNNNARTMSSEDRAAALGSLLAEALDKRKAATMSPGSATAQ